MTSSAFYFALFCAICLTRADEVNWTDCGSKIGTVTSVKVEKCDVSMSRCQLRRNTNVTVDFTFTANKDADSLDVVVHGVVLDMPVPFAIPNPNGCVDSGITCPVVSGKQYMYTNMFPVLKKYPRVTVDVKWEIKSGGEDYMCILIPAKLV